MRSLLADELDDAAEKPLAGPNASQDDGNELASPPLVHRVSVQKHFSEGGAFVVHAATTGNNK